MKYLNNQSGYAFLLGAVVLSAATMTSLGMTYIYTNNKIKYHTQIKEAYHLVDATEGAAKKVKSIWDQTYAAGGPTATVTSVYADPNIRLPMLGSNDPCRNNAGCPNGRCIRVDNTSNPSKPYCFIPKDNSGRVVESVTDAGFLELKLQNKFDEKDFNRFQKFAAKLNRFFESTPQTNSSLNIAGVHFQKPTFLGWVLHESKAIGTAESVEFTTIYKSAPASRNCSSASPALPGCMPCKTGTGDAAKSACSIIEVCPSTWASCSASPPRPMRQAFRISTNATDDL